MDLKDELDLGRQILGNGKADIPRKDSKMGKKAEVRMGVMMEKAGYNVRARRQNLFNVVLGVKLRRMNWKRQGD